MHWLDLAQEHVAAWLGHFGPTAELLLRLFIAAVAGGLVGLEREMRGRQAGFRTNLLVCMGSCLTMIVSLHFAEHPWTPQQHAGVNINVDPSRIAYGVMTGVGFLGAGTIIRNTGGSIRGLTTAAAMWCVAAIGLAAGFGLYVVTAGAVVLTMAALWLLEYLERVLPKVRYRTVTVRRAWQVGCLEKTVEYFRAQGLYVDDLQFHRTEDMTAADIQVKIGFTHRAQYFELERKLESAPEYEFIAVAER